MSRSHSRGKWKDLNLPDATVSQLRELTAVTGQGRSVKVLFAGPPGTGKTVAADAISGRLGVDLLRVDLSQVVSKYIGETEKNLAKVFDRAERSGAILFFDEADALFGKRTKVRDSHDRYANIEVSHLLDRLEEHTGVVIVTVNDRKLIDPQVEERFDYTVSFPGERPED